MINSTKLKRFTTIALTVAASQFVAGNASATASIFGAGIGKGIALTSCQTCHNSASGSESTSNLKPNIRSAYLLDKTGLTRLKNVINGCPTGQALNPTTFVCAATVTPTKVPTPVPTVAPTKVPTPVPTVAPTKVPTPVPTVAPTKVPTPVPTVAPTSTPIPTVLPTAVPTRVPTGLENENDENDENDEDDEDDEDSSSHETILPGSVGKEKSGSAKTDSYEVTCPKGTEALAFSVSDSNPAKEPEITIQASKRKATSALSTDIIDGDAIYSPIDKLSAGSGKYKVNVNKSKSKEKGAEAYTAKVSCDNANGSNPASKVKLVKNQ
jgi:hypothetical protein